MDGGYRTLPLPRARLLLAGVLAALAVGGCARLASSALNDFTGGLGEAILNHDDPALIEEAMPAWLLVLDSLAADDRADAGTLSAAARLYAAYVVTFVEEGERAALLATRARDYGRRALCAAATAACGLDEQGLDAFQATLAAIGPRAADGLLGYAVGSLAWVRTHSGQFAAMAELPKLEAVLQRLLEVGQDEVQPSAHAWLGILNSLRPEALGGRPGTGRAHFERAVELSGGRDLGIKVEFARTYARLVYDRELHDRLLREVLDTPVRQPGLTLFNVLAVREAKTLLATADDYF